MLISIVIPVLIFATVRAYDTVCYNAYGLGCYTNAPPWGDSPNRPNNLPDNPETVNARFYLDTRNMKGEEIYFADMEGVASTAFNPNRYTRFIVHGYIENGNVEWMDEMSSAFLAVNDENIIRVGWFGGSLQLNYGESAVDTQIVGDSTGNMINNMINTFGMSPGNFHCIGHSLGAHICGYAGTDVPGLGRISGLDPAGPYFEGTADVVKLDSSDAQFVDIIHSDAEELGEAGLGTAEQSGHVDFWPNSGRKQPGCDQNAISTIVGIDGVVDGTKDFVACNHIRAVKFFTESILSTCPFKSYPCLSYDEFLLGKCLDCDGTGCPQMGYHAIDYKSNNYQSKTYLSTNAIAPFCEYMTDIGIRLGPSSKSIDGSLYLTLYGPNGATDQQQIGGEGKVYSLRGGDYYSSLTYYDYSPGSDIEYVKILWTKEEIDLIGKEYLTFTKITVWVGALQKQFTFCGDDNTEMKQDTRYILNPGSC